MYSTGILFCPPTVFSVDEFFSTSIPPSLDAYSFQSPGRLQIVDMILLALAWLTVTKGQIWNQNQATWTLS